ncbi:MAG: sigma-70 family RNA polymerase sigma factor [Acidobacteriota bacterium]
MSETDSELVRRTLDGDQLAFEQLVRRYERFVFNVAYHYLGAFDQVDDVAQEVFLKVYDNLAQYDTGRPFKTWVGRIAANRCIDELRRRKRQRVKLIADLGDDELAETRRMLERVEGGNPLTEEDARRALRVLHQALESVPDGEREAYILREVEGLEYDEVARICGISEPAVRIRVSRARKRLQEKLEDMLHGR